jgi:hypothetical protein
MAVVAPSLSCGSLILPKADPLISVWRIIQPITENTTRRTRMGYTGKKLGWRAIGKR